MMRKLYSTGSWLLDKAEKALPYLETVAPTVGPDNMAQMYGFNGIDPDMLHNPHLDQIYQEEYEIEQERQNQTHGKLKPDLGQDEAPILNINQ